MSVKNYILNQMMHERHLRTGYRHILVQATQRHQTHRWALCPEPLVLEGVANMHPGPYI